jgi:glyoxylase-like metal-dependent hydrolase (beta-lactamase superfamily II)
MVDPQTAATATAAEQAVPQDANQPSVTVRMYRGMLGDCFLLTIRTRDQGKDQARQRPYTVLIDCGVLQSVQSGDDMVRNPDASKGLPPDVIAAATCPGLLSLGDVRSTRQQAELVVDNLFETLRTLAGPDGRPTLDVLVVTHEHYDHISGFTLNADKWQSPELDIKELWLAWTEDPVDPDAIRMKKELGAKEKAVRLAAKATAVMPAAALGARGTVARDEVEGLLAFLGAEAGDPLAADGGGRMTNAATIQMLKRKVGERAIRYLEPGMVIDPATPEPKTKAKAPGLRTYVLGPPRNIDLMKKDAPSSGAAKEVYLARTENALAIGGTALRMIERYEEKQADGLDGALAAASPVEAMPLAATDPEIIKAGSDSPFAMPHRQPYLPRPRPAEAADAARADDSVARSADDAVNFYEKQDGESGARAEIRRRYESEEAHGRRIDGEWFIGAEAMALKLDSDTNNTSLVLAFELPDAERRILLFAADAQVGNWLSWSKQPYPAEIRPGETQQTSRELLARTVFYKVGHHGSHNATAKEQGLEQMTNNNLVAAIPVVEAVARIQGPGKKTPGKGWHMPYEPMYEDLKKRTGGKDDPDASKAKYPRIIRGDGDPVVEAKAFVDGPATIEYGPDNLWVELTYKF